MISSTNNQSQSDDLLQNASPNNSATSSGSSRNGCTVQLVGPAEDKILLRQTKKFAVGSRHKSLKVTSRAKSTVSLNLPDNDQDSFTTTSDVNSDDDAASIASRLSQIVIEEQEKLADTRRSTGSMAAHEHRRYHLPESLNRAKSSNAIVDLTDDLDGNQCTNHYIQSEDRLVPEVPQIHVSPGSEDNGQVGQVSISESPSQSGSMSPRLRTKSVGCPESKPDFAVIGMRRNESLASFNPLRGDLRSLEAARGQHQSSAQVSCADMILNISRSSWTLSEFDQAFNKFGNAKQESGDPSRHSRHEKLAQSDSNDSTGSSLRDNEANSKSGENLLIRASKNAINKCRVSTHRARAESVNCQRSKSVSPVFNPAILPRKKSGADLPRDQKESDCRRYSTISFPSSMDSSDEIVRRSRAKRCRSNSNKEDFDTNSDKKPCWHMSNLKLYLPILDWLPSYRANMLWHDLFAGLTVAVLNISISLSAAVVAETDLSVGFRGSIINTFIYSILCTSRHVSFGSWSIVSQMLLVSVQRALSDELILDRLNMGPSSGWDRETYEKWHLNIIIMDTFLIGLVQLTCGALNLGNILASFIPEALSSSMIVATALTMALGQLANMFGSSNKILWSIEKNSTDLWAELTESPEDIGDLFSDLFKWVRELVLLIKHHETINLACVVISISCVLILAITQYFIQPKLKTWAKKKILIPSEMILLVLMVCVSYGMSLGDKYNMRMCGPIIMDFSFPVLPNLRLIRELWVQSLATALISYTIVCIMAKTYSHKLNYEIDFNQELIACGAGNLVGGLFEALPATASFGRTSGQYEAGGQTQMASLINVLILIAVTNALGHHTAVLPVCVMSAFLFFGFFRMLKGFRDAFYYYRICKVDFSIWVVTFVSILALDLVKGFVYGLVYSILTMIYRAQSRRCYLLGTIAAHADVFVPLVKYPVARELDGIKIFQFCGPIHYICADLFERLLRQKTRVNVKEILRNKEPSTTIVNVTNPPKDMNIPSHIILDFSMISYIDSAGLRVIKKIIDDYQRVNVTIFVSSLASHVATVIKSDPLVWEPHKHRFYVTLTDAVHYAQRARRLKRDTAQEIV